MEQKNDRQKWLRMTARVGTILFGNAIYAMAVVLFIMPNGLVTCLLYTSDAADEL